MKKIYFFIAAAALLLTACHKQNEPVVETEQFSLEESMKLAEEMTDSLHISITFEYPTRLDNPEALALVQSDLKEQLFGEAFRDMEPQHAMEAYAAMLKTEYKLNNLPVLEEADDEEGFGMIFCEEQDLDGRVMGIMRGIISYSVERYVYAGGPHGSNFRLFRNYCLACGKAINEDFLFTEGYEEALTGLLLHYLLEQNEDMHTLEELANEGYELELVVPNGNFYLAEEGIIYVFNAYDIAPYAMGETEILLPWSDVAPYLKDEFQKN